MAKRIFLLFLLLLLLLSSCTTLEKATLSSSTSSIEVEEDIDYAGLLTLNEESETVKSRAEVLSYIDGDTTHFLLSDGSILKARYIACNTPESTGKIEPWGKSASLFTKEKLKNAYSILVESDTSSWNYDSTGSRTLVWVWYKESEESSYRNLNLELLQEGFALPSASGNNRYGSYCQDAIREAQREKKHIWSNEKDPNFYYGDKVELTLKELRMNTAEYEGKKVSFEAVVTRYDNNSVYVEDYDEESGLYFGFSVYYGFNFPGSGLEILSIGNRVNIVGTVQYYENGGSYQVSGIKYRQMRPDDPDNVRLISTNNSFTYQKITLEELYNKSVEITSGDETKEARMEDILEATTIELDSLYISEVEKCSSDGSMTLKCIDGEESILLYISSLLDKDGNILTPQFFLNKTISLRGILTRYSGLLQIKLLSSDDFSLE